MKPSLIYGALSIALVLVGRAFVWGRSWELGFLLCAMGVTAVVGVSFAEFARARGLAREPVPVPTEGYLPQLDGLRFLAFMLVFAHHMVAFERHPTALAVHDNGWMGVDLFFVVSSFLFFVLLFREQEKTGRINIFHFFVRRTLRIWPLYFGYLLFIMALTESVTQIPYLIVHYRRITGSFLFLDNVLTFLSQRYHGELACVDHLWTLSFEEQVYLVTPFLAWFTLFAYRRGIAFLPVLLFLAIPAVGIWLRRLVVQSGIPHPSVWVLPILRSETVCAGFLVAMFVRSRAYARVPSVVYVVGAMFTFVYLFGNVGPVDLSPHSSMTVYAALGIGFSCLLLSVVSNRFLARVFGLRPLAYLGKISFGLYVWHLYAMDWSKKYVLPWLGALMRGTSWERWWSAIFLTELAVTVGFAAASYKFYERPFLRLKKRFTHVENRPI